MNKKKLLYMIFLMISIIITGTLAYFTIVTERTALVLTLGEQDEVLVTLEPFEINGTLSSTVSYTSLEDYIQITAENFSAIPKKVLFYYRINSIEDTLISTKLKYSITSSSTIDGTYTEVETGNFSTAAEGHDLTVYEFDVPANTTIFYRVFTYLDGNEDTTSMSGSLINAEFRAEMEHVITPDLDEGMIPVKYVYDEELEYSILATATNDSSWFDYENHQWANAVLVTEESRSKYLGTTGVYVNEEDILAALVWIPRYEYRYNNLGNSYAGGTQDSPGAISINFIPSYVTVPTSSAYKIHPAFTFDDNEINGFWVGKVTMTIDNVDDDTPKMSMYDSSDDINGTQSQLFESSIQFCGGSYDRDSGQVTFSGSDYYGTTSNYDSHLMKGSEYGAIAYLSQSIYGQCDGATSCEAFQYFGYTTEYIDPSEDVDVDVLKKIVSGVFFYMNDNDYERVMSVLQYDSNFIYSGIDSDNGNSRFKGYIGDVLYDTDKYSTMPPSKYYDRYTSTNILTACNGEVCYGHALSEVDGWYGNNNVENFVRPNYPWLVRGQTSDEYGRNFTIKYEHGGKDERENIGASYYGRSRAVILNPNGSSSGSSGGGTGTGTGGGATMLIEKANDSSITTYSSGVTTEMYTFSQPATTQLAATTDYRYIGSSPNNYITFNDETWRIIGVFDGRIKLIKDTSIGSMPWDYKRSGIGSSTTVYGSNDWVDAQLMYMLNPSDIATNVALKSGYNHDDTYVYDARGNIIYQKGCQPADASGGSSSYSYSCTSNTWALNNIALSQVADVIYYLGGTNYNSTTHYGTTSDIYAWERGEVKYNDVRSTTWTGKVGLMYPSDYGYTFAYGVDDACYNDPYLCILGTPSSSWLYKSSYYLWMLSPSSNYSNHVFLLYAAGQVDSSNLEGIGAGTAHEIHPVVYLKSDITLTGTGTSSDPYTIVS